MSRTIIVDLESRSTCNLTERGAFEYAQHSSTQILCAVMYDLEEEEYYYYDDVLKNKSFLTKLEELRKMPTTFVAHNIDFELPLFKRFFSFVPTFAVDTVACAYAANLPPSLNNVAKALGLGNKLARGADLILRYCVPIKGTTRFNKITPDDYNAIIEYCRRDVELCTEVYLHLYPLIKDCPTYPLLTHQMNARGLPVEVSLARKIIEKVQEHAQIERDKMPINVRSTKQILDFCSDNGVELENTQIQTVEYALANVDMPACVREVLQSRVDNNRSSLAKYQRIVDRSNSDNRACGCFQYYGAHTGRDAGRYVQPQNFPRGDVISCETLPDILTATKKVAVQAKEGLRGIIRSDRGFLCGDFVGVETRVLLWLAGDIEHIRLIRENVDLYQYMAAKIYECRYSDITKEQRHLGKIAMLGLGYGMGSGVTSDGSLRVTKNNTLTGFMAYAKSNNMNITKENAVAIVRTYRDTFYKIVELWNKVNGCFQAAVLNREVFSLVTGLEGRHNLEFLKRGRFLSISLPSQRKLLYFCPCYSEQNGTLYSLTAKPPASKDAQEASCTVVNQIMFYAKKIYGGKLVENITQAIARDVLFAAHKRLDDNGYEVVGRFHDELLVEKKPGQSYPIFKIVMSDRPSWAAGLPINIEGWEGGFYRK